MPANMLGFSGDVFSLGGNGVWLMVALLLFY